MRLIGLMAALVLVAGACWAQVPAPLGVRIAAMGGGPQGPYTPGVEGGTGLNNIGLLVRTWGKVTFVDAINKFFYIDDGSARLDGSGNVGLRVSYDNLAPGNTITPPSVNSHVLITGISSTVVISSKIQPNLLPRRQDDIQVVEP